MSKFDTSRWKEFAFKDLFENIRQGARLKSADHIKGNLPFVMAGNVNLGISGYIGNENVRKFSPNAITIDIFGNTFYRDYEFGASDDVGVFWNDKNQFSDNAMIFIVSVISKFMQGKFDFANKLRASQTYDFKIKLPINQNGEIDFEFMETTIKNTKSQIQNILNAYKSLIQRERESKIWNLDFSSNSILSEKERSFIWGGIMQIATHLLKNLNCEWREFNLTELFTYERGTRLTKNDRINGKYPLVTAGEYNKGVKEYISNENQKVFKNAITIDMFCNSFVHIDEFCCDDNVLVLTSKTKISKEAMIFISSIINKDKDKWGYEKQYRQNSLEKHKISLPIDKFGNPNFEIMEKFIKEIEKNHTSKLLAYYHKIMANGGGTTKFNLTEYLNFNPNLENKKILWREFRVGDIFDIQTGSLLNSRDLKKGNIKRISAKNENNGIIGFYDTQQISEARHYENFISINFFGNTFYHPYIASVEMKVHVLKLKNKSFTQGSGIFIASILKKLFSNKFGYGNQLSSSKLKNENFIIKLPTYENGEIAFDFMENYISNLKNQTRKFIQSSKKL